jgi:hypothetical protein
MECWSDDAGKNNSGELKPQITIRKDHKGELAGEELRCFSPGGLGTDRRMSGSSSLPVSNADPDLIEDYEQELNKPGQD